MTSRPPQGRRRLLLGLALIIVAALAVLALASFLFARFGA